MIANQTITKRLDQAERELAEHRAANVRERNQTTLDPLRGTSNPQNSGLFGTPEIPSARSGCYTGENSQRPPPHGMTLGCNVHEVLRSNSRTDQQKGRGNREHGSRRRAIQSLKIELHPPRGDSTKRDSITQQNKLGGTIFAVPSISIPKGKTQGSRVKPERFRIISRGTMPSSKGYMR